MLGQEGSGLGSCVEGRGPGRGAGGMWAGEGVLAGHHRRGPASAGPQGSPSDGEVRGVLGPPPRGTGVAWLVLEGSLGDR